MHAKRLPADFYERIKTRLHRRIGRELGMAYRVLDLGCGGCELARFLRKTCRQRVTGVDISGTSLPRRDNPREGRTAMRCIEGNAARLTFLRDGSVDAVVTTWAVHEMKDPKAATREAHRVLRPGGKMLIVDFPKGSLAKQLWGEAYLTARAVAELLRQAGFVRIRSRTTCEEQVIWAVGFRSPDRTFAAKATDELGK